MPRSYTLDAVLSRCARITAPMSYNVTLFCGCVVYVSCHPVSGVAHTRVVERRGEECRIRNHDVGARVWLWEMLPPQEAFTSTRVDTREV